MTPTPMTDKDLEALEKYLDSRITALRETIGAAYPARTELLELISEINGRITCLEISKATLEGKANQTTVIVFGAITVIGFFFTSIGFLMSLISFAIMLINWIGR